MDTLFDVPAVPYANSGTSNQDLLANYNKRPFLERFAEPAIGAAETGLSIVSGIPGGVAGTYGKLRELFASLYGGKLPTQGDFDFSASHYTPQWARDMTYDPRSEAGQAISRGGSAAWHSIGESLAAPGAGIYSIGGILDGPEEVKRRFTEKYGEVKPLTSALLDVLATGKAGVDGALRAGAPVPSLNRPVMPMAQALLDGFRKQYDESEPRPVASNEAQDQKNLTGGNLTGRQLDIRSVTSAAKDSADNDTWSLYRKVDQSEATAIKQKTGLDVEGYDHHVDKTAIRHVLNTHRDPVEEVGKGQVAVVPNDFEKLPEITQPENIIPGATNTQEGLNAIRYRKQIGDVYYVVEEVRTGRKRLALKTMWKTRAAPRATY